VERALRQLDEVQPSALQRRCRLLLQFGDALMNAGQRDRGREVLLSAAELAQKEGLTGELATAALRFAPDLLAIETGVCDEDLIRLLEDAIASVDETATSLRAQLFARLAIALQWSTEEAARSKALCESAVQFAAESGDREAIEYVSTVSSFVNFSLVQPVPLVKRISRRNVAPEILQRLLRVTSLLLSGRANEADAEIVRFTHLVQRSRHPQARWYIDLMRATRAHMKGQYAEAAALGTQYLALGLRFGDRNALHSYAVQTIMSSFDIGGVEVLEPRVKQMVEAFPGMPGWRSGLALFLAELGRHDDARVEFKRAVDGGALEKARPNEWYGAVGGLALSCGVLGERATAEKVYAALLPHRDHFSVIGYSSYCLGSTERLLAAAASGSERFAEATVHFEAAIARNLSIGARACNARVYFEQARMLDLLGRRAEMAASARSAVEIARSYGMERLAGMAGRLARC
jgi:tetratricopeptide (TPR) repeat protein